MGGCSACVICGAIYYDPPQGDGPQCDCYEKSLREWNGPPCERCGGYSNGKGTVRGMTWDGQRHWLHGCCWQIERGDSESVIGY
jgi:hypothetical protein